jgi:hypothetical protein
MVEESHQRLLDTKLSSTDKKFPGFVDLEDLDKEKK